MSNASSEPAPHRPIPWGPASAIVISVAAFLGAQVLAGFLVSAIFVGLGLSTGDEWLNSIAGQFLFVLLSDGLIVLVLWLFLRHRRANFKQLGFMRKPRWSDAGYALLGFAAYFGLLIVVLGVVSALTHIDLNQRQELGFEHITTTGENIMALISLVILPPLVEETVFRGFLYAGLRKKLTFLWATIITSLLFAGPHLLASSHGLLWVAGVDTLVLSFALCYLREKTGALWACIAVHALKNSIAFFFLVTTR